MPVDKNILDDYIDACALIRETEKDIREIKKRRKTIEIDSVKGSMNDFPYAPQNFKIQGVAYSVLQEPGVLEHQERILEERKANAEKLKTEVDAWMNTIPMRMQRIIRMKFFEKRTWEKVAMKMGRKATPESVKKEFQRFLEESKKMS